MNDTQAATMATMITEAIQYIAKKNGVTFEETAKAFMSGNAKVKKDVQTLVNSVIETLDK